jgi:HlyD family secretion protein
MRLGVVGLVAAVALGACRRAPAVATGTTARVARSRIERLVTATGTIEPEKQVEVRPRISGIVQKIHVAAGDMVAADQPLVEIERELIEAQLAEARAQLQGARVELHYARNDLVRATDLRRDGTLAVQEHERANARVERAEAEAARGEATVNALEVQLRYTTVTAPLAGKILDVPVEEGSAVAAVTSVTGGTVLLTLATADRLHLKGLVDENEIRYVAVGQAARVRTEANGTRTFPGVVREIKPLGDRQQNVTYFEVKVDVASEDGVELRPRMSADADIVAEVIDDALVVPETALQYEGNDVFVERVLGGDPPGVERRRVQLGIVDGDRVQVLSGLDAGEEVRLK